MKDNYYFSPTSLIDVIINRTQEKVYNFCTPWQTVNINYNGK